MKNFITTLAIVILITLFSLCEIEHKDVITITIMSTPIILGLLAGKLSTKK